MPTSSSQRRLVKKRSAPAERHQPTKLERYRRSLSGIHPDSRYLLITTIVGAILQLVLFFMAYAWLTEQFPGLKNGYFTLFVSFAIVVYFGHLVYNRIPLLQRMMAPTQDSEDTTSVEPTAPGFENVA